MIANGGAPQGAEGIDSTHKSIVRWPGSSTRRFIFQKVGAFTRVPHAADSLTPDRSSSASTFYSPPRLLALAPDTSRAYRAFDCGHKFVLLFAICARPQWHGSHYSRPQFRGVQPDPRASNWKIIAARELGTEDTWREIARRRRIIYMSLLFCLRSFDDQVIILEKMSVFSSFSLFFFFLELRSITSKTLFAAD